MRANSLRAGDQYPGNRALAERAGNIMGAGMSTAVNAKGYRYPILHDGCTGCELCAKVCPDFCFAVYRGPSRDTMVNV